MDSANYISNMPPLATSDVTISSLSGNNLSPALDGDLALDGLVFLWLNNGASVNGANTLTLGAGGIDMVAANHSITINCPIVIGADQKWLVGQNSPGNTLTVNGNISGSAALSKGSWGTLILNGTNSFSGALNIDLADTGGSSSGLSDGITRITRGENVANVPTIAIRNNNAAWSTLQLTNLLANLTIPANVTLAGRNTNVAAIENLSGSNTISGGLTINSGGGFYLLQSDSGTLNFGGTISAGSSATGARTLTFQGGGDFYISGSIQNGSASTINVAKTNSGALTFFGLNTFSGSTTNWRGNLFVNGTLTSSLTVAGGTLGGGGTIGGAVTIQSGATLSPGNSIGALNFGNNLTLAAGSTNFIQLNESLQTNDAVKVTGALAFGGTLVVTNLAGRLAPDDSFKIFSAGSHSGNFSALKLPPLDFGLAWNTNGLTNEILSVVATVAPQFSSIARQSDGNFVFNGAGAANGNYELDAATNLATPVFWMFVTNAAAGTNGLFQLFDLQATNYLQRFYRISAP